jgi:hypothetical protein
MYKFNQEEFDNATNKDSVTCWCKDCGTETKRLKIYIKHNIKHNVDKFDCPSCKEKEKQKIIEENTKVCLTCNISFFSYENKFCSNSCAATTINKTRVCNKVHKNTENFISNNRFLKRGPALRYKEYKKCLNCERDFLPVAKTSIFCEQICSSEHRKNQREKELEPLLIEGKVISQNIETNNTIYRRYLIRKFGPRCMKCGWSEVNPFSGKVPIELEHKDGNCINNIPDNLELLCPNCHSLSQFYKGANKREGGSPRYKQWKKYFSIK